MGFVVVLITVGSADNVAEQLIQADLAARGISVNIRQLEMGSFLTLARNSRKRFDLLLAGIPGDLSLSSVQAMFNSEQRGGALDYTGYHTPVLDVVLQRARLAAGANERTATWRTVQMALDQEAPATWIYHSRGVQGISGRSAACAWIFEVSS